MQQLCYDMVYRCQCADSPINDTMYNRCVENLSSSVQSCNTTLYGETYQGPGSGGCLAGFWSQNYVMFNFNGLCGGMCDCCGLNTDPNYDCGGRCRFYSSFFVNMAAECRSAYFEAHPDTPICTNEDGDNIFAMCRSAVYDCYCANSPLNDTMYELCLDTLAKGSGVCSPRVQCGTPETDNDLCPAQAYAGRQLQPNSDYICNQACNCCDLNTDPEVDCFQECKHSSFFKDMGVQCANAYYTAHPTTTVP